MTIHLQMLGTGSAFGKKYYNTNALIHANGFSFMIDCGVTAPLSLHALNKPIGEIDALLITHLHADHIGGMEEFAFAMKYKYNKKPPLYLAETLVNPLWEHSLRGGLEHNINQVETLSSYFDVRIVEEGKPFQVCDGLQIEIKRTVHIPSKPSYSLFINDTTFYSADVIFDPDLIRYVSEERQCTRIIHECQLKPPYPVHTGLEQLLKLPESIQEKIWLMHYDDDMEDYVGRTGKMTFMRQHVVYDLE